MHLWLGETVYHFEINQFSRREFWTIICPTSIEDEMKQMLFVSKRILTFYDPFKFSFVVVVVHSCLVTAFSSYIGLDCIMKMIGLN